MGFWAFQPSSELFPLARAAALKAIELDDGLAEAHAWLGVVKLQFDWDWSGAEQELIELRLRLHLRHESRENYLFPRDVHSAENTSKQ